MTHPSSGDIPAESESRPTDGLSGAFDRAIQVARAWHRYDLRKGSDIPYIAHLLGTASFVLEAGGNETQVIAALFHDALEDAPDMEEHAARRERIAAEFGEDVLRIVEDCTDGSPDEKREMEWLERKRRYLSRLEREAALKSLLVTAADKLHNARAILYDVRRRGPGFLDTFHGSRTETLWYHRELARIFRDAFDPDTRAGRLATELSRVVAAIEAEVEGAGRGGAAAAT